MGADTTAIKKKKKEIVLKFDLYTIY